MGAAVAAGAGLTTGHLLAQPKNILPPQYAPKPVPAAAKAADMPPLLKEALGALDTHSSRVANRDVIGLVDFSQHSREQRFQLIDVPNGRVMETWYVSHGRGSDPANTGMVQKFSNRMNSHCTSRGSYLTAHDYYGKHGHSRRLMGLDPDNNLAMERAIVVHGADYVDESMALNTGRVGRSLGCFAVERTVIEDVLQRLGPGHLLYASKA
ncbi:murein L,D-transpeptidase catalytic domain family protein [Altericroceibacterium xinjiangense]|uniref:murein L,D-transpeptidase catalytic domain family protein n=1 Tax=Altericroceibacterium xinjiangense TaxID=762261 RepID=UPI001F496734|nr:murein L,D-transpeptidase catalytic domain family protein [Altericroceibacterium xinjiangense]